jgi:hypothetical protein
MPIGTLSVVASSVLQTNDQRIQKFYGQLKISAFADTYPVGGLVLDSVLAAALMPTTNQPPIRVMVYSCSGPAQGDGYIYQRICATGKLMILQVPPSGSLTTAAPLQEVPSNNTSLSGPFNDTINFVAEYVRNA